MATEIRVPTLGESITEAIVGKWFKKSGDAVNADEPLVELETDKVTVEVPAPSFRRAGRDQGRGRPDGRRRRAARRHQQRRSCRRRRREKPRRRRKLRRRSAAEKRDKGEMPPSPSARKKLAEAGLDAQDVAGSGKRGQILKEDVARGKAEGVRA